MGFWADRDTLEEGMIWRGVILLLYARGRGAEGGGRVGVALFRGCRLALEFRCFVSPVILCVVSLREFGEFAFFGGGAFVSVRGFCE